MIMKQSGTIIHFYERRQFQLAAEKETGRVKADRNAGHRCYRDEDSRRLYASHPSRVDLDGDCFRRQLPGIAFSIVDYRRGVRGNGHRYDEHEGKLPHRKIAGLNGEHDA